MEMSPSALQTGPAEGQDNRFGARRDRRQLYALDRRNDAVVYLPEGQAAQFHADCIANHLVCPLPNCAEPEYTTVGGTERRHHFRHRSRGLAPHDLRTWSHLTAALLLESVLSVRHPEATIARNPDADDRAGESDLLASFPDGRRFALAVQYTRITPEQLHDQHRTSLETGLIPVWIFGHLPPLFRRPRHEHGEDLVVLGTLLRDLPTGTDLFFIDPDQQKIATGLRETSSRDLPRGTLEVSIDAVTDLAFHQQLLLTPAARRERQSYLERIARQLSDEERIRDRQSWRTQSGAFFRAEAPQPQVVEMDAALPARPKIEEQQTLPAAERAERAIREQAQNRALEEWEGHGREAFLRTVGLDQLPSVIDQQQQSDRMIFWLTPAQWRARLIWRHLRGRRGETFTLAQATEAFLRERPDARRWEVREAIADYLPLLRREGWLHFEGQGNDPPTTITVLADFDEPPSPRLAELARGGAFVVRLKRLNGYLVCMSWEGELLARLRPLRADETSVP
jgi:hypothetical protein